MLTAACRMYSGLHSRTLWTGLLPLARINLSPAQLSIMPSLLPPIPTWPSQVPTAIHSVHLARWALTLCLIDAPLYRDQAAKLVVRLQEHIALVRTTKESIAVARLVLATVIAQLSPAAAQLKGLQANLLEEPDAERLVMMKHLSVVRYAAVVERERKRSDAKHLQHWCMARVLEMVAPMTGAGDAGRAAGCSRSW